MFLPLEEEQVGLVKGVMPDSKEEWWVSLALDKYDIPYMFQFEIFGGKTRRGGLIVDFVVWNPMATPFPVYGEYWHKGELTGGDKTALIMIADYFKVGVENIPILWVKKDGQTKEDVFSWVRINVAK